jgi:hypothetical protein
MATDANEKELSVWGFTKGLRTGLITFIMAIQMMAIIYLYVDKNQTEREKYDDQAKRYQEMIKFLQPAKDHLNAAAARVDTAAARAISSSQTVDSLTNELNKQKKIK